jgi:hypothetical protein
MRCDIVHDFTACVPKAESGIIRTTARPNNAGYGKEDANKNKTNKLGEASKCRKLKTVRGCGGTNDHKTTLLLYIEK